MAGRRIVYGAALLAALAFQIFYDGYLAQYLLACVAALPILSLALSLPGAVCLRLRLAPSSPRLTRGASGEWLLEADNPLPLPVARVRLRLTFVNTLTGARQEARFTCRGLSGGQRRAFPMDCRHCGALDCQPSRARVLDALGLFALPVAVPAPARALILPDPAPLENLPELDGLLARAGGAQGRSVEAEDYEIRDYRPGDPVRDIHWKLSSKRDEPVIRERLKRSRPRIVLSFDLFGGPERLDRVLALVWSASAWLTGRGLAHTVRWRASGGGVERLPVGSRDQLLSCMARILASPAPASRPAAGEEAPEAPGTILLPIAPGEEAAP